MTEVVQFVGIEVSKCTLTYATLPCRAQQGFDVEGGAPTDGSAPNAIYWGDSWAKRGAGLTGAADSQSATGSFWYFVSDNTIDQTIFAGTTTLGGTTTRFRIRFISGIIRITGSTSGGTSILDIRNATSIAAGSWYHILFSFNLANSGQRHLYVDDVSDLSVVTYTNNTIDFTLADWSFGALPDGTASSDSSDYADFWLRFGLYTDFSVSANRRAFISANGSPVYLGTTGQAPSTASPQVSPIIYFGNPIDSYQTNLGTGGGFTIQNTGGQDGFNFATGSGKCFNSLGTCQDLVNYTEEFITLYFSEEVPRDFLFPLLGDVPVIPFIKSIDYQPAIVSLEGQIGQRASVKVVFRDAPHSDAGDNFDKYPSSRSYNPYEQGSFWGKFRARNPYMRGRLLTLFIGEAEQDIESFEKRYFIIDSTDGPNAKGEFTITGQDVLKFASGDRSVAPLPSNGYLAADITTGDITITISPTGILSEYPASGFACIGGSEIVSFDSISGDNVNIFDRGSFNTEDQTHNAQDRFQLVLTFDATDPAIILDSLLEGFAGVDDAFISTADWQAESATYLGTVNSLVVTEPTGVDKLVEEILEQTGSALWWDDVNQQVRWQVIRSIPTTADRFNEDQVLLGTLDTSEQPDKRVSRVIVYFGQINPTLKVDETHNYRSTEVVFDGLSEDLEGSSVIKTIYARAIAEGGRTVANRIGNRYLSRYVRPPRRFNFELLRDSVGMPALGGGYLLGGGEDFTAPLIRSWPFQDATGERVEIPIQLTRVASAPEKWIIEAEEMLANAEQDIIDITNHTIFIDSNQNNINLKNIHDSLYAEAISGDTINCYINSGVRIGSNNTGSTAFDVGTGWNAGVTINVFNAGRIEGAGGVGGGANFGTPIADNGAAGGTAFYTRQNITLENNSEIWGGGGGGGGAAVFQTSESAGGGGAGISGGGGGIAAGADFSYSHSGNNGASDTGGSSNTAYFIAGSTTYYSIGGTGGNPGNAGTSGSNTFPSNQVVGSGGAAGYAIDGISFVTLTVSGSILGSQVN